MNRLADCLLYGILDLGYIAPERVVPMARAMIAGGVDIIQLRAKKASFEQVVALAGELHPVTFAAGIPLIINDHPRVAQVVPVEGIHVGQDDLGVAETRAIVERKCWVGKSTHSVAQASAAVAEGADYIGFGPLFATPTKPDYAPVGLADIAEVHRKVSLPIFCIGGIKLANLPDVLAAGARRVVIVSGLLTAPDAAEYARSAKSILLDFPKGELSHG